MSGCDFRPKDSLSSGYARFSGLLPLNGLIADHKPTLQYLPHLPLGLCQYGTVSAGRPGPASRGPDRCRPRSRYWRRALASRQHGSSAGSCSGAGIGCMPLMSWPAISIEALCCGRSSVTGQSVTDTTTQKARRAGKPFASRSSMAGSLTRGRSKQERIFETFGLSEAESIPFSVRPSDPSCWPRAQADSMPAQPPGSTPKRLRPNSADRQG